MLKLLVEHKKIDIPDCHKTISVEGEDRIEKVCFVLPTFISENINLSEGICTLTWQNSLGTNIVSPLVAQKGNRTEVTWVFTNYETAAAGQLQFFIEFVKPDGAEYAWVYKTNVNYFLIARTLPQGDPPPNPPDLWNKLVAAGDCAKRQGDYAKERGDYAHAEGVFACAKGIYAKEQGDYAASTAGQASEDIEFLKNTKVDKVSGKGLSTNDLTDILKNNYDLAFNQSHYHNNKPILDATTATYTAEDKIAYDGHVDDEYIHVTAVNKSNWNNKADLEDGKVPASQLPSYVDDIIVKSTFTELPAQGESGKVYVVEDTNIQYRWNGSGYTEISASLALGETSSTAYAGDRGKLAYDLRHEHTNKNILDATTASYLAAEKTKLANIASGAQVNVLEGVKVNGIDLSITGKKVDVTKASLGLGNVDDTSDANKPVSTAQATAINAKYTKPSTGIPKTDLATAVQQSLTKADTALQSFTETDPTVPSWAKAATKPTYTKAEIGLGSVSNALQATKTEFDTHSTDSVRHITPSERTAWNAKLAVADIINELTSTATNKPLSANMGKFLYEVASGKTNTFVIDTLSDLSTITGQKVGDVALIIELSAPDRWWSGTAWEILETTKVDLTNYYNKTDTDAKLLGKVDKVSATTTYEQVYSKAEDGSSQMLDATMYAIKDTVVKRTNAGHVIVPTSGGTGDVAISRFEFNTSLNTKVDKVTGKQLSTNDYDNAEKQKVADNTTAKHTHSNKTLLDTYNQTNANLTTAVTNTHTHTNKAVLDATTASYLTAEKTKLSGIATGANNYTHPNSGVAASTYKSVTVNAQGHVTAGSNPTTLSGFGISNAYTKTEVDTAIQTAIQNTWNGEY